MPPVRRQPQGRGESARRSRQVGGGDAARTWSDLLMSSCFYYNAAFVSVKSWSKLVFFAINAEILSRLYQMSHFSRKDDTSSGPT